MLQITGMIEMTHFELQRVKLQTQQRTLTTDGNSADQQKFENISNCVFKTFGNMAKKSCKHDVLPLLQFTLN